MFSELNTIWRAMPRQAETTDTRQEILRHDPDQRRRKQEDERDNETDLFGDDRADISIESLEAFLHTLLRDYTAPDRQDSETAGATIDSDVPRSPNAQAAGAYARTADYHTPHHGAVNIPVDESVSEEAEALSNEEIQMIHRLLSDIEHLKARGIQSVKLLQAPTFLECVAKGIRALMRPEE